MKVCPFERTATLESHNFPLRGCNYPTTWTIKVKWRPYLNLKEGLIWRHAHISLKVNKIMVIDHGSNLQVASPLQLSQQFPHQFYPYHDSELLVGRFGHTDRDACVFTHILFIYDKINFIAIVTEAQFLSFGLRHFSISLTQVSISFRTLPRSSSGTSIVSALTIGDELGGVSFL